MNNKIWFICLIVSIWIILFKDANAKIWIVDNNPISAGDFTTLADAHSAASNGDTIFVYPSATTYAGIAVTKQLFFFGVGFNLDIYGGQASDATSSIGNMTFNTGSEGSELQGFDGNFQVDINTSGITVKRNNLNKIYIGGSSCIILQNHIEGNTSSGGEVTVDASNIGGILISNNKIRNTQAAAIVSNVSSVLTVINNVIKGENYATFNMGTTSFVQSNIILKASISANPVYQYNMCNSNQLPVGDGNILNIDMNTVFEDPTDWIDGLHLLPGSPAIGTGFGGTDMGIYGGDAPFIDGGYPGLPAIFHLESEGITTPQNGLDVVIKAKSNKE